MGIGSPTLVYETTFSACSISGLVNNIILSTVLALHQTFVVRFSLHVCMPLVFCCNVKKPAFLELFEKQRIRFVDRVIIFYYLSCFSHGEDNWLSSRVFHSLTGLFSGLSMKGSDFFNSVVTS